MPNQDKDLGGGVVDGVWTIDVTDCDGNKSSFEMVIDGGEVIILVWNK